MDGADPAIDGEARPDLPGPPEYLAYYSLHDVPFPARAPARSLWLGASRRAVLEAMAAAVRQRTGVLVLTGEVGSGKTSLVDALADALSGGTVAVARVGTFGPEESEFLAAVAKACGLAGLPDTRQGLLDSFGQFLDRASGDGRSVLLVIDEAQRLGHDLLRAVDDLSRAGSLGGRRLMILLAGQTDLEASLLDRRHTALVERIVARHVVEPLTFDEVGDYVRHCLRAAGAKDDIFSADAVREVARLSRGIPATIGTLCDRALLAGRQRRARTLRRHSIEDSWSSISQMEGGERALTSGPRRRPRRAGEPSRSRAVAAKRIAPAAPSHGDVTAPAGGPGDRPPVSPEETAIAPNVAARAEGPAGPEIATPTRPADPVAASRPAEGPRPSAFSRPAAPPPPAAAPRPPRARGRTRARPRSPFRRVARLLVAGLAALFLIVGGYSFYGGAPTTISHPVVSPPPSPADPGTAPGPPAAGPPTPAPAPPRSQSADTTPGPGEPAVRATAGAVTVSGRGRAADTGHTRADPAPGARSTVGRPARPSPGSATDAAGRQPELPGRTEPDAHDPGGVIDWLLNEYPRKSP